MMILTLTERLCLALAAAMLETKTTVWVLDSAGARKIRRRIRALKPPARTRKYLSVRIWRGSAQALVLFNDGILVQ